MIEGLNVLIAEDSIPTQMIIKSALQEYKINMFFSATNEKAKSLFYQYDFSLVIVDVNLEDGISESLVSLIVEKNPRLPILVMTSDRDDEIISNYFNLGAKDFSYKPINMYLLSRKVKSILESYTIEKENHKKNEILERVMHEKNQEEALAFYVYDHILNTKMHQVEGIEHANLSHGKFCGDVLITAVKPDGNFLIMLADATGHGMAAALTIYPLVSTFSALAAKGFSAPAMLVELSEKHAQTIPHNRFIACILIELSIHEKEILIWNAGMPDVLLFDRDKKPLLNARSKNMALGILPKELMSTKFDRYSMDDVKYAMLLSDGVIEDKEENGKKLSFNEVYEIIKKGSLNPIDVIDYFYRLDKSIDYDDMSVCWVDFDLLKKSIKKEKDNENKDFGSLDFNMTIRGKALSNNDLIPDVIKVLEGYGFFPEFLKKVFVVLTELYTNSVDHGLLGISSKMKEDDFVKYIAKREVKIKNFTDQDYIELRIKWEADNPDFYIFIKDSGKGYKKKETSLEENKDLYGRGLGMIEHLSKYFSYDEIKNETSVILN